MEATKPDRTVSAVTGMIAGREIRMRAVNTPFMYKAHLRGRIRANGTIIGTFTDNEGSRGQWTITRR